MTLDTIVNFELQKKGRSNDPHSAFDHTPAHGRGRAGTLQPPRIGGRGQPAHARYVSAVTSLVSCHTSDEYL